MSLIGWQSFALWDMWDLFAFEFGLGFLLWFVFFSVRRKITWNRIKWYAKIMVVINIGSNLMSYVIALICTILVQGYYNYRITKNISQYF